MFLGVKSSVSSLGTIPSSNNRSRVPVGLGSLVAIGLVSLISLGYIAILLALGVKPWLSIAIGWSWVSSYR